MNVLPHKELHNKLDQLKCANPTISVIQNYDSKIINYCVNKTLHYFHVAQNVMSPRQVAATSWLV